MKVLKKHYCFGGVTEFLEHTSCETKTTMKFSTHRPSESKEIKGGVIWLSGLTCNEENFITKAGAQKYLADLGLVLICPDTSPRGLSLEGEHESYDFGSGAGFYVDATTEAYKDNYRMYSYINDELYQIFNEMFQLKGNISIMGHSMGGHGALVIGLKNPEKYKSVSAFSPIVNPINSAWGKKAFTGYLGGNQETWGAYDTCSLIRSGARHGQPILVEQGLADDFYPDQLLTENLESECKSVGQEVIVNYRDAYDHSYYFISTFIESHLRHHKTFLS